MYRMFCTGVVLLWITAMTALFYRDVWPAWTAQTPPPMTEEEFRRLEQRQAQFGLFLGDGERVGTAWSDITPAGGTTRISGTILLDRISYIPVIRIQTVTDFDKQGVLDRFLLDVFGIPMARISVHGERRGSFFPCSFQIGPVHREANLDLPASRMIGESLRPFSVLPTLEVGQAWRMQMLDPLSVAMRRRAEFTSVVVRVTGRESIRHRGEVVECFVVETFPEQARAWVDDDGHVLVQEAQVPGLGKLTVRQEPFDEAALISARQQVPDTHPLR